MADLPHDGDIPTVADSSGKQESAQPNPAVEKAPFASASPASTSDEQPPDIDESIKVWIRRWAVRKFGWRLTYAGLVILFVGALLWKFRGEIATGYSDGHDWVGEHWLLRQANPGVFTVALVHLDNDEKGPDGKYQMENDVADVLRSIKGIAILDLDRPPIADEDVAAGHKIAKQYLKASGAQVLIWGRVFTLNGKNVPKLYWTVAEDATPATESRRYALNDDLSLPPIFVSDLDSVLQLLVVTESASFAPYQGRFIANLSPFIEKVQNLLLTAQAQGWNPDDVARVRLILGGTFLALGSQNGQNEPLRQAIATYELVLEVFTRSHDPIDWARTQNNLGSSLCALGERESGTDDLQKAVAAYNAALLEFTRARVPLDWAMTQNNLGNALDDLGERESGTADLQKAVAAYNAALLEYTRDRVPLDWAMTQNNLGNALTDLGERESGTAAITHLNEAVAAYHAALLEYTRDRIPLDWAATENNLGAALDELGGRESGTTHLQQAIAAYQAALLERTRDRVPLDWATTQNNLGNALDDLGERESGTAAITHLNEAVAAYHAALLEFTRDRIPPYWAATQNNLGDALAILGERESGTADLQKAVAAYNMALQERTRDRVPRYWATTQNNLGAALYDLGKRDHDVEEVCSALQAHINAWQVDINAPYQASRDLSNAEIDLGTLNAQFPPSAYSACIAEHAGALRQMGIDVPKS